ncbi:DUF1992 domain-containing protein [Chromobacterium alticapitis]|uniref:DUF1992 domain-containing protein n=2 Tax=Chromobacterium alticapitis TaxID=2073169 RepID=A0A2S5DB69_9NEIS|nr:DUF1992 domain-containing protein [Chromobacterium alticapitis]
MLETFDQEIAAYIRRSEESGELRRASNWGKPLEAEEGYEATPADLRMGYKILKNAGVVPPEVEMMKTLRDMRLQLSTLEAGSSQAQDLKQEIQKLQLALALQMDALRGC